MRHISNDKYTIAWFKLAECVAKGEKEKAFGVYRLLMHSIEDQAYAYQLEGDLLGAFSDERAVEKYLHAAHLYYQNNRYKEAAALYEELIIQIPEERYINRLIDMYKHHKNKNMCYAKLIKLADLLVTKELYIQTLPIVQELENSMHTDVVVALYTKIICGFIKAESEPSIIEPLLYKALDYIIEQNNYLQIFLSTIEQENPYWYQKAQRYLANNKD